MWLLLACRGGKQQRRQQLKQAVNSFQKRMKIDFGFDEGTAAKLAVGLGDGVMPALSLFGPPMVGGAQFQC